MNPVGHAGHSAPLGATVVDGGVNFSLFSHIATGMELLLVDRDDDTRPARLRRQKAEFLF
jgi:glycogen operon protein